MKHEFVQPYNTAKQAQIDLKKGNISYDMAKSLILPYIELVNKEAKATSKKYKLKPKYISFMAFTR